LEDCDDFSQVNAGFGLRGPDQRAHGGFGRFRVRYRADEVLFDLATNTIESGAGGANIAADTNGTVSVVLRTNVDEVRITSDTQGGVLGAGTVEDIPFDNIVEVGGGTDIPHPAWDDATGTVIGAQGGAVIGQLTEDWTFQYDNTNAYVPGSYTATVIYTATTL
jgi:hypothetical protein